MNATWIAAWTLLHFVWQGALVAAALALVLAGMSRQSALRRYVVAVVGLALMAALPVFTSLRLASASSAAVVSADPGAGAQQAGNGERRTIASDEGRESRPSTDATLDEATIATENSEVPLTGWVAVSLVRVRSWGDRIAPALVVVWLSGVLLLSLRLLGGWSRVRRLTTTGATPAPRTATTRLEAIAACLGVRRAVQLMESSMVHVPAVVGWLRPVLLMPVSLGSGLSVRELELLLAHELAHIRRHDYFINVLQTIVETALFYHPAIWWVSRQIREEREHCCDDIAAAFCGNTREYAEALVRLEGLRRPVPVLAAAANGGNLVRRIRRLIEGRTSHVEGRTRWTALPLAAAALTGIIGGTRVDAATRPAASMVVTERAVAPVVQQRGTAAPDTVVRHPGGTFSLGSRVDWATAAARSARRATYWIGYVIAGDPDRGFLYMNRHVPVVVSGGGVFTGSMRFTRAEGLIISGVRLDSLVGPRSASETVILLGYRESGGRATLDRVQLSSGMLPVHFDGRALYWLGESEDAESIALMRRSFADNPRRELKHDLITATGAHLDGQAVLAQLRSWLASSESEETRAEVAEQLAQVPLPAAVGLLARTARDDRSVRVRREAAEALGEVTIAEAGDTLVRLINGLEETSVAREAIEALGERREAAAFDALVRIVWEGRSLELQREAVETMGESHDERRAVEVERVALTHRSAELRREAVETLGEHDDVPAAIRVLRDVINQDAVGEVRQQAVETLGELDDSRAFTLLTELARSHRDVEVRKAAISALADNERTDALLELLREMIQDPGEGVARAGVEALGEIDDARAVELMEATATRHRSSDVRVAAIEALGSADGERARAALLRTAREGRDEAVQLAAIESYAESAPPKDAIVLLAALVRSGSRNVQVKALDELADLDENAGMATIIEVARAHPDGDLRRLAIEHLGDSDDPRAHAELARLLKK